MNQSKTINYYLEKIRQAGSLRELDKIATEFYSDIQARQSDFRWDIDLAVEQKESELLFNNGYHNPYDLVRRGTMVEVGTQNNSVVDFDPSRRKAPAMEELDGVEDAILLEVKCGCQIKYNVPCIHRSSFNGILPKDYKECDKCGCDHRYDPRLSKEVHTKLGESI